MTGKGSIALAAASAIAGFVGSFGIATPFKGKQGASIRYHKRGSVGTDSRIKRNHTERKLAAQAKRDRRCAVRLTTWTGVREQPLGC